MKRKTEEEKTLEYITKSGYSTNEIKQFVEALKRQKSNQTYSYKIGRSHVKMGVFGDTHIGNINYDPNLMRFFAKETKKQKVDFVLNLGDVMDGWYQNRPASIFEQNAIGFDQQMNKAVEEFSQLDVPIYFITGNHTYNTYVRGAGVEAGPILESRLKEKGLEAKYLGNAEGDLVLKNKTKIKLLHPDGGTAYALSYRPQKIIESLSGGEKPNLLFVGHFHKLEQLFYRNVHCFDGSTKIATNKGNIPIRNLKKGDLVLTHKNRFRKVVQLHQRWCDGNFIKILFRNKDPHNNQINSTPEHPILIVRDNKKMWVQAKKITIHDFLLVNYIKCKHCGKHLPYWRKSCNINKGKPFAEYKIDKESGFVLVPVEKVIKFNKRNTKVYNIGVDEDNTYLASNVVVHNCFQTGTFCGQTKFMKGKNIPAHKGFWIMDIYGGKDGGVDKIVPQLYPAYT